MENREERTHYLKEEVSKCEDINELVDTILPRLKTLKEQWSIKIKEIIKETGLSSEDFGELVNVSRATVYKWRKGAIPRERETFFKIGMAANYEKEQIDKLLQRYGQFSDIYAKNLKDCICNFVIKHWSGKEAIEKYNYILSRIESDLFNIDVDYEDMETLEFEEKLSTIKDESELEQFIFENTGIFRSVYHKFYAQVKIYLKANLDNYNKNITSIADGQGWSSSLKQAVSGINQGKWVPTRNKIIALGIYLNMSLSQVDNLLELAHMEPLCPKNILESVIIFALEDAELNNKLCREDANFDPDELYTCVRMYLEKVNSDCVKSLIKELQEMDY